MRNCDAAGQPGRRLFFAGHRRGDQTVGVAGAPGVCEAADEARDDGLLVGARVDVEQNQTGVDDGSGTIGSIDFSSDDATASGDVYVNDLKAGQCLNGAGFATDEPVSGLEIVDCSTAHDVQVLEVNLLDSEEAADYKFDDPRSSARVCNPVLSESQKALVQSRDYGLVAFTETGSPVVGDKVACLVKRADDEKIREFLPVPTPEQLT